MQLEYDLNVGALYIRLSDRPVARTLSEGDNTAVDLDAEDQVVGIEVISIAHPWPLVDILAVYNIPPGEETQILVYFPYVAPRIGVGPPAPAAMLADAA